MTQLYMSNELRNRLIFFLLSAPLKLLLSSNTLNCISLIDNKNAAVIKSTSIISFSNFRQF